jgi:hypothetical protein
MYLYFHIAVTTVATSYQMVTVRSTPVGQNILGHSLLGT